jgi:hypothetical protein
MNRHSFRITLLVCLITIFALNGFSQQDGQANDQQKQKPGQGNGAAQNQGGGTQPSATNSGYTPFDSFPVKTQAQSFGVSIPNECLSPSKSINNELDLLKSFATSATSVVKPACIVEMVYESRDAPAAKAQLQTPGNAIILHVLTWTSNQLSPPVDAVSAKPAEGSKPAQDAIPAKPAVYGFQPVNGAWGFYIVKSDKRNLKQQTDSSGTPYFYNAKHVYLVDINVIDNFIDNSGAPQGEIDYTIQATARQKQNEADLATLFNALLKMPSTKGVVAAGNPTPTTVWGTVQEVQPGIPLPYDLAVTVSLNPPKGAPPTRPSPCAQSNPAGAKSQSACSATKTVTNYDPEFWDVSLGVAIPGPVEMTYKSTTTAGTTTVTPSKVTHTDAYAFGDIYLFQHFSTSPVGLSNLPHINFGIPITSQSLHRPYVGMAEGLNFLTSRLKLGVPISVYAGPVFMKQQIEPPGTTTLKWDRATKMIYGIELPISSITNYLKGGGSSKNSGSSKSGGSSGNGAGQ